MPANELVQSLTRGLEILEAVAASDGGLTVAQVADALGLKRPTAHNLVRTLAARDYLRVVAGPARYRLGPAFQDLLTQHAERSLMQRVEQSLLEGHLASPGTSWLYVEAGNPELRVNCRIDRDARRVYRPTRDVLHPYGSATGLCAYAFAGDPQREVFRARYPFEAYRGGVWEGFEQFEAFAVRARGRGYAQPPDGADGGFRISAPVLSPNGDLLGMIGLHHVGKTDRPTRTQLTDLLLEHSETLSHHPMEHAS